MQIYRWHADIGTSTSADKRGLYLGVDGLRGELVLLLAVFVKHYNDPISGADGELDIIVGPRHGRDFGRAILVT